MNACYMNLGHPEKRDHLGPWAAKAKLLDASCTHGTTELFESQVCITAVGWEWPRALGRSQLCLGFSEGVPKAL